MLNLLGDDYDDNNVDDDNDDDDTKIFTMKTIVMAMICVRCFKIIFISCNRSTNKTKNFSVNHYIVS